MLKVEKSRKRAVKLLADALSEEIKRELFLSGKYKQRIVLDKRFRKVKNKREWLELYS